MRRYINLIVLLAVMCFIPMDKPRFPPGSPGPFRPLPFPPSGPHWPKPFTPL